MGVSMRCLDPTEPAPAAVAADHVVGHFRDAAAISEFAKTVDVLTVEIEHIDADALEAAAKASGVDVEPTPATVRVIQDKYAQKRHFDAAGVPVAPYLDVPDAGSAAAAAEAFGLPMMLKSKRCGGRGARARRRRLWRGAGAPRRGAERLGAGAARKGPEARGRGPWQWHVAAGLQPLGLAPRPSQPCADQPRTFTASIAGLRTTGAATTWSVQRTTWPRASRRWGVTATGSTRKSER